MTYNEWRDELKNNLLSVSESERAKVLDYYAEAYADRREAGFSERDIIEEFGAPFDAAQRILADAPNPDVKAQSEPTASKPEPTPTPVAAPAPKPEPAPTPVAATVPKPAPVTPVYVQPTAATATAATAKKKKSNLVWILPLVFGAVFLAVSFGIGIPLKSACRAMEYYSSISTTTYTAEADYTSVRIKTTSGSVRTEFYDGDKITIEFPISEHFHWSISDLDGVLTFETDVPSSFNTILGTAKVPESVIKLPNVTQSFFDIEIESNAGSVTLGDGNYNNITIDLDVGGVYTETLICEQLNCTIDAGNFYAKDITCTSFKCDLAGGETAINKLTCPTVSSSVSMGSLKIGMTGAKSEYNITATCNMGSSNIESQTVDSDKKIDVSVSMGILEIKFDN